MKTKFLIVAMFMLASVGASAGELNTDNPNVRANELIERVNEIKNLDRSEMTRQERKEAKSELREISKELKQLEKSEGLDDKVSISIGAIIIIILLLILI